MKTENTLRTARNSLLCFFMALGAGFLVACGGGGSPATSTPPQEFSAYLLDTAVEGVEYSGPEGDGLTGKGGVFLANEGVFVFSIGGTTLGSVRMSSNQENNEVTPSDFLGVNEAQVITIARIMQGLDEDDTLTNGISISQNTRDNAPNLFTIINSDGAMATGPIGGKDFTIPLASAASVHLAATRKCLFSGGYVGDFEGALLSNDEEVRGQIYYAVEPFASPPRARRFVSSTVSNDFESFLQTSTVGVIGSTITLSPGNELSFTTPRLVAGVWQYPNDGTDITSSGTENLTIAADTGNPGATRRIVGVETAGAGTVAGMYVLDYFEEETVFRGRHYDVDATGIVSSVPLSLAIANGVSWPVSADGASNGMTTVTLTLSGMRGEEVASITLGVVRADGLEENANENYGSFEGVGNELSGTWCDIGGAVGSTVAPTPLPRTLPALPTPSAPRASAQTHAAIEVTWSAVPGATSYNLYRSTVSGEMYAQIESDISDELGHLDIGILAKGLDAETEYFYRLEACNSGGCSRPSPEVSVTTKATPPRAAGQCYVGQTLTSGSCEWNGNTFEVRSDGAYFAGIKVFSTTGSVAVSRRHNLVNGVGYIIRVARTDASTWVITELGG